MAAPEGVSPRARIGWPRQAWMAIGVGALVSVAACAVALIFKERRVRSEFASISGSAKAVLAQQVHEQERVLRFLRALWQSSDEVRPDEFHEFTAAQFADDSCVLELQFVERVGNSDRSTVEDALSLQTGRKTYLRSADGQPAPQRDEHMVLRYREPPSETRNRLGEDYALDPFYAALLAKSFAADSVRLAGAGAGGGDGTAVLIGALPVYDRNAPQTTEAERESALAGYVVGVFSLQQIVSTAAERFPAEHVDIAVVAPGKDGSRVELASSAPGRAAPPGWSERDAGTPLDSVEWLVVCTPQETWLATRQSYLPWLLLVSGLLLAALTTWSIRTLSWRNQWLSKTNAELYTQIADRHSVEKELRETQRALATLVSNLPGVAYRCANDEAWSMEFISDGCIPLTGRTPSEFLTGAVNFGDEVIHDGDRQYVWNAVQQALERQRAFQLVYRIRTAQGVEKWVWEQGRGVYSRAGELLALEGFMTDITERKKAEEALKREKRFADAIIESLPGNFYVFDEDLRFLRWNKNVERVTGYSADELAHMTPAEFFVPEDRADIERAVAEVFERGQTRIEGRLLTKSGESVPFFCTGLRFAHEGETYLVGMGLDLSDRERARAEAAHLRSQLLETHKFETLGVMAGGIAHDFNNLLTVVLGSAGLARQSLHESSPAREFLDQAIGASRSATQLTQQLLVFVDGRNGAPVPLDLSRAIRQQRQLLQASIQRNVFLELELADDLPPVRIAPVQLQQVLLNLVLNGAEACADRPCTLHVATGRARASGEPRAHTFGTPRAGPCAFLSVRDDGAGMDEAVMARLGEAFFTTKLSGRGLGLAAVLGILRDLGGWLEVDSTLGRGSTFAVFLPVEA